MTRHPGVGAVESSESAAEERRDPWAISPPDPPTGGRARARRQPEPEPEPALDPDRDLGAEAFEKIDPRSTSRKLEDHERPTPWTQQMSRFWSDYDAQTDDERLWHPIETLPRATGGND